MMDVLKMIAESQNASEEDRKKIAESLREHTTIDFKFFIETLLKNMPEKKDDYILVRTIISYYKEGRIYPYGMCRLFSLYDMKKYDGLLKIINARPIKNAKIKRTSLFGSDLSCRIEELNLLKQGNVPSRSCCEPIMPTPKMLETAKTIQDNSILFLNQPFYYASEHDDPYDDDNQFSNPRYPLVDRVCLYDLEGKNVLTSDDYNFVLSDQKYEIIFLELLSYIAKKIERQQKRVASVERINQIEELSSLTKKEKRILISTLEAEREEVDTPYTLTRRNLKPRGRFSSNLR